MLWVRYVDDILAVAPQNMDLNKKLDELNLVDPKTQLTIEHEKFAAIPFLDTEIVRTGNQVKFKVYRKPTNREDYVHFFSVHTDKVKRGIVIGFFLRAFRVCSEEYLEEEIQHIILSFMKLKYPKGFLLNLKKKAINIRNRSKRTKTRKKDVKYMSIPNSETAETIAKNLETTGIRVAVTSGRKIGEILSKNKTCQHNDNSVVYKIPCGSCDKSYIGETGRGMQTRLKEHKRDLRNNMDYSAFVVHAEQSHHLPNWAEAGILACCKTKGSRKATEAAYIATNDTINTRAGFIKWAKSAALYSIKDNKVYVK